MNKKFVYQVGNNKKLYYDARPTKYQVIKCHEWAGTLIVVCEGKAGVRWCGGGHKEGENGKVTPMSKLELAYIVCRIPIYFFPTSQRVDFNVEY